MSTATFVRNARRQRCQQVKSLQGPGSVFLCKSDSLPVPCWPPCAHFLASLHPTFPAPGEVCAQSIKTDPGPWSFSRTPWWLGWHVISGQLSSSRSKAWQQTLPHWPEQHQQGRQVSCGKGGEWEGLGRSPLGGRVICQGPHSLLVAGLPSQIQGGMC